MPTMLTTNPRLLTIISTLMSLNHELLSMRRLSSRCDLHQEYAVGKACESIHLTVAIRKPLAGRPLTHHSRTQTYHECKTIEEHVDTIAQESQ